MSRIPIIQLTFLRAVELLDAVWVAVNGVTEDAAVRAVVRVLRARAFYQGETVVLPDRAALYLPIEDFASAERLNGSQLEPRVWAILQVTAQSGPRIRVRQHHLGRQRLWACAPLAVWHPVGWPGQLLPTLRMPAGNHSGDDGGRGLGPTVLAGPRLRRRDTDVVITVPARGLTIGRGATGAARVVEEQASRLHASVTLDGPGRLLCRDLGSRNGTWVDGRRIAEPVPLIPGQRIRVGNTEFEVVE